MGCRIRGEVTLLATNKEIMCQIDERVLYRRGKAIYR